MTATELRARAKQLRAEATRCIRDAESLEAADASAHRAATSRAALEVKAASMCRPVWGLEGLDGVYVVVNIEAGCFLVRDLRAVGGNVGPYPYRVRDGRYGGSPYTQTSEAVRRARLDHVATMLAWRAWCESRRAAE